MRYLYKYKFIYLYIKVNLELPKNYFYFQSLLWHLAVVIILKKKKIHLILAVLKLILNLDLFATNCKYIYFY